MYCLYPAMPLSISLLISQGEATLNITNLIHSQCRIGQAGYYSYIVIIIAASKFRTRLLLDLLLSDQHTNYIVKILTACTQQSPSICNLIATTPSGEIQCYFTLVNAVIIIVSMIYMLCIFQCSCEVTNQTS